MLDARCITVAAPSASPSTEVTDDEPRLIRILGDERESRAVSPDRRDTGRPVMKVVMFDLDGTLINTMNGFADVAADVMTELHGLDRATARRRYLETSGLPFRQQVELIAPVHPNNDTAGALFEEARKRIHADRGDLDDATTHALERMRAMGLRLVVSSNSSQSFVDELAARQTFQSPSVDHVAPLLTARLRRATPRTGKPRATGVRRRVGLRKRAG